jgi:hypothetical protein
MYVRNVAEHLQAGAIDSEEGVEEAFELIGEIPGKVGNFT